jgi:hypothetical protein
MWSSFEPGLANEQGRDQGWDVFLAHAGPDLPAASELAEALSALGLRSFLDANRLRAGDGWPILLKRALASSMAIVVLVSSHSDDAYYLQEEVAIAIILYRKNPDTIRIVPVLRRDAEQIDLPYGTVTRHMLKEDDRGWPPIAESISEIVRTMPDRPPGAALANSLRLLDDLWAGVEPALTDKSARTPDEYRMRFGSDGQDLVARSRDGVEYQRATRDDLEQKLSAEQLQHLEILERSMEINKAIWDERYPNRVLDKRSKRAAEEAADALAEDLSAVLSLAEQAGMWLDDHYLAVREVVANRA